MTSLANRRSAILLFSLPDCLHSHRTRLVIKEKEISAELHEIDLNNISEEIKFIRTALWPTNGSSGPGSSEAWAS